MRLFILVSVFAVAGCLANEAEVPEEEIRLEEHTAPTEVPDVTVILIPGVPSPRMAAGTDSIEAINFFLEAGPRGAAIRCITGRFAFSFNDPAASYTLELAQAETLEPLGTARTVGGFAIQHLSVEAPVEGIPLLVLFPHERAEIVGTMSGLMDVGPHEFMFLDVVFVLGFAGDEITVAGLPVRGDIIYVQ